MPRVLVAITGASGAIYGVRLVQRLAEAAVSTEVVLTEPGRKVLGIEHGLTDGPAAWTTGAAAEHVTELRLDDITAAAASGSSAPDAMIVAPCSMGTAGRLAAGLASNLLERSADVMLKERRPLVLVPRETPLSSLHLRNLLSLSELGATIVPAMPAFYGRPTDIEDMLAFVVDRAARAAGLDLPLRQVWRAPEEGPAS